MEQVLAGRRQRFVFLACFFSFFFPASLPISPVVAWAVRSESEGREKEGKRDGPQRLRCRCACGSLCGRLGMQVQLWVHSALLPILCIVRRGCRLASLSFRRFVDKQLRSSAPSSSSPRTNKPCRHFLPSTLSACAEVSPHLSLVT